MAYFIDAFSKSKVLQSGNEKKTRRWVRGTKIRRDNVPIFVIFLMVLLVSGSIFLASYLFYDSIQNKVKALRGTASMLASTISDPVDPRAGAEYWVEAGLENSRRVNTYFSLAENFQEVDAKNVSLLQRELQCDVFQCRHFSDLSHKLAQDLVSQEIALREKGIEAKGTSFEAIYSITGEFVNTTQELELAYNELVNSTTVASSGGAKEMDNLRIMGIELTNYYYQARALIGAAMTALPAGDVNILAPFLLITVLYTAFLLFPWILLLLFFLRKRKRLVEAKTKLIRDFNLTNRFSQASEGEMDKPGSEQKKLEFVRLEIEKRTFRESEYLVSLALLTVINATLLYFFFYPNASSGLAQLISTGGGVRAFADYLASDSTPITFGFIGAYFFVIQMLLRRYFAADLNPNVYNYAVVRVLTVFILSLVLQLATTNFGWPPFAAASIAFVVGIFPSVGLRWILRTANKLVTGLRAPEFIDRYPLTELDGLNTWHEARLMEEKIENVQGLATASLDDLIINTNFYPLQLVDWVDQALFYIYSHEGWRAAFHLTGIRTATDFLNNTSSGDKFDRGKAENLSAAINAALASLSNDTGQSSSIVRSAFSELSESIANISSIAKETVHAAENLSMDKPETLDAIEAAKKETGRLVALGEEFKKMVHTVAELRMKEPNVTVINEKDITGLDNLATDFCNRLDAILQEIKLLDRRKPDSLTHLANVRNSVDALCAVVANLQAQLSSIARILLDKKESAGEKTDWNDKLENLAEKSGQILAKAQEIRGALAAMNINQPETFNMVMALQIKLNVLCQAASNSQIIAGKAEMTLAELQVPQPILKDARKSLKSTAELVEKLIKLAFDAKDRAAYLDVDTPATLVDLSAVKGSVTKVLEATEEAKAMSQKAVSTVQNSVATPKMEMEFLEVMYNSIRKGPNVSELESFWKNYTTSSSASN